MTTGSLILRADATATIGGGHIMRCLALANAWKRAHRTPATFVTHCDSESLIRTIRNAGHVVTQIARGSGEKLEDECDTLFSDSSPTWVVVDGYQFTNSYYRAIKAYGHRVLALDDDVRLARYDVDALLNQNIYAPQLTYSVPEDTKLLLGTSYCCLRVEFRDTTPHSAPDHAKNVLITMGASDDENNSANVLQHLSRHPAFVGLSVRVVVGPANPHRDELSALTADWNNCELVVDPPTLAAEMEWADVAIAAAGSTMWELCFVGVPTVAVAVADNQRLIAKHLDERGAAICFTDTEPETFASLVETCMALLPDKARREALSAAARQCVDGQGADRVVAALS